MGLGLGGRGRSVVAIAWRGRAGLVRSWLRSCAGCATIGCCGSCGSSSISGFSNFSSKCESNLSVSVSIPGFESELGSATFVSSGSLGQFQLGRRPKSICFGPKDCFFIKKN